ncbi:MAG: hypothetical protein KIT27_02400 [Legionellales bacterium]|nr:hypothetical protein [Legionellales bacterium]
MPKGKTTAKKPVKKVAKTTAKTTAKNKKTMKSPVKASAKKSAAKKASTKVIAGKSAALVKEFAKVQTQLIAELNKEWKAASTQQTRANAGLSKLNKQVQVAQEKWKALQNKANSAGNKVPASLKSKLKAAEKTYQSTQAQVDKIQTELNTLNQNLVNITAQRDKYTAIVQEIKRLENTTTVAKAPKAANKAEKKTAKSKNVTKQSAGKNRENWIEQGYAEKADDRWYTLGDEESNHDQRSSSSAVTQELVEEEISDDDYIPSF